MYYIAYGSNINRERMTSRCPNARIVENGTVWGWKLSFNMHVDLIPGDDTDSAPVVVWDIVDEDWPSLDKHEGYPKSYDKKELEVTLERGGRARGIAYVMAAGRRGGHVPPQAGYLSVIEEGYRENGLDMGKLCEALAEAHRIEFIGRICTQFHAGQSYEDYCKDIRHLLMLTRNYRTYRAAKKAVDDAGPIVREAYDARLPAADIADKIG